MADFVRCFQQPALRRAFQSPALRIGHSLLQLPPRSSINTQRCLHQQSRRLVTHHTSSQSFRRAHVSPRRIPRSFRRFQSTHPEAPASPENLSLTQRMRKLSREYGYSALGVYLALSALDLPFCYMAVSYLGAERVGKWEHAILSYVKGLIKWPMGSNEPDKVDEGVEWVKSKVPLDEVLNPTSAEPRREKRLLEEDDTYIMEDHGVKEATKANTGNNASFWTTLALAYAIHKSFIFVRVPITAAITPKVVKTLRGWGWNIGKKPTLKFSRSAKATKGTGVNSGKTGIKPE